MAKSNFKFSNIIFCASIVLSIIYFACKIGIIHFYSHNNIINKLINDLNSSYLFINMIFISLLLIYLSKINKKIKFLSLKFKMDLQKKGIVNYSLLIALAILLIHLTVGWALKISFINNWSQKLSPILTIFLIINLVIFISSLTVYTFLLNFSNFLNKIYKWSKLEVFIKKTFKPFVLLVKRIKIKTINYLKFITVKVLTNFKVNYILFNSLQWEETFRKSQKLNNNKKACAPGCNLFSN